MGDYSATVVSSSGTTSQASSRPQLVPVDLTPFASFSKVPQYRPRLHNWSHTFGCTPELFFHPATIAEVQTIVSEARRQNRRVRPVGEGNSPSECWASDEWMVSLRAFQDVNIDAEKRIARLGAGLRLDEVHPLLYDHGLSMPATGSILEVSVGACFSGSEHGTGFNSSILSAQAVSCILVTALGQVIKASRDGLGTTPEEKQDNKELFSAAVSGLGLVGIVLEATFECVLAFDLEITLSTMRFDDVIDNIDHLEVAARLDDKTKKSEDSSFSSHNPSSPMSKLEQIAAGTDQVKLWWFPNIYTALTPSGHDTIVWSARKVPVQSKSPSQPSLLTSVKSSLSAVPGLSSILSVISTIMSTIAAIPSDTASWCMTTAIHLGHMLLFAFVTHVCPPLQPAANTLLFFIRSFSLFQSEFGIGGSHGTGLSRSSGLLGRLWITRVPIKSTQAPMPGWEAQVMDCLYSQLVDEWAVPLSSSKECPGPSPGPGLVALRKVHDMLASPEGANVHMHAPFEIRFGGASPEHVLLSPLYPVKSALSVGNSDSGTSGSLTTCFIWLEPVLYRPFNLPLPARHGAFIRRFEDIVRSHEGRAHLTKTHVPVRETVTDGNSVDRLRRWRTIRDKWDPEGMWWNEWLERHWMGTTSMSKEGGEEVEENLMASGGKDVKGRVREIEDGEWEAEGVMGKQSLLRGDGVKL